MLRQLAMIKKAMPTKLLWGFASIALIIGASIIGAMTMGTGIGTGIFIAAVSSAVTGVATYRLIMYIGSKVFPDENENRTEDENLPDSIESQRNAISPYNPQDNLYSRVYIKNKAERDRRRAKEEAELIEMDRVLAHYAEVRAHIRELRQINNNELIRINQLNTLFDDFINGRRRLSGFWQSLRAFNEQPAPVRVEFNLLDVVKFKENPIDTELRAKYPESDLIDYMCPILQEVMNDPVRADDGHCYERWALVHWYKNGRKVCPLNPSQELSDPSSMPTDTRTVEKIKSLRTNDLTVCHR